MTERDLMREISRTVTQQEQMMHALDKLTTLVEGLVKRVDGLEARVSTLEIKRGKTWFDVH